MRRTEHGKDLNPSHLNTVVYAVELLFRRLSMFSPYLFGSSILVDISSNVGGQNVLQKCPSQHILSNVDTGNAGICGGIASSYLGGLLPCAPIDSLGMLSSCEGHPHLFLTQGPNLYSQCKLHIARLDHYCGCNIQEYDVHWVRLW